MRITLIIIFGFLAIAGTGFYFQMRTIRDDVERQYSQAAEEPLVDLAHILASLIERDVSSGEIDPGRFRTSFANAGNREFSAKIYNLEKNRIFTNVYITDRDGIVIFDSEGTREGQDYSQYNDVYLTLKGEHGVRASRTDSEDSRSTVFFVAAPITDGIETIGVLTVSRPEHVMAVFADETRRLILRSSLIAGGIVVLVGALWTYAILSPIGTLTRHARKVKRGERTRVPETGRAELRTLSRALEDMRHELEGRHYVENYVQALTHELKSPLAAIQGAAELLGEEDLPEENRIRFLENIQAETARCEDLVRRLVQLASLENQTELEKTEPFDFTAAIRDEIEPFRNRLEDKKIRLKQEGLENPVEILGDSLTLRFAIRNLLANAIDFSPEKGEIEIRVESAGERVSLSISDQGPGVPDYARNRIFDRFYSLKHSATGRKGSGLGLCFVKEAAELHGGSVTLENRDPAGTRAILELPVG